MNTKPQLNAEKLVEQLTPLVAQVHLELDDLSVVPVGKRAIIRVTVDGDGPNGSGPDLDQITAVSRLISRELDAGEVAGNSPYTLEVSSRGVSRPLTKSVHYRRNTGRLLAVTLMDQSQLQGRIVGIAESRVTLATDDQTVEFDIADVAKAVVQVETNRRAASNIGDELSTDDDFNTDDAHNNDETDQVSDDQASELDDGELDGEK